MKFDKIDCKILELLQQDCRMSLTDISKKLNLSVDSTRKRVQKLLKEEIFYPKIMLRPRHFGYPNIVDVKIKLRNYNEKTINEFIEYTVNHPRITEVFSLSGEWDFTLVIISKDHEDLADITKKIREKFSGIISDWRESLTTIAYKFERYDMERLVGLK